MTHTCKIAVHVPGMGGKPEKDKPGGQVIGLGKDVENPTKTTLMTRYMSLENAEFSEHLWDLHK